MMAGVVMNTPAGLIAIFQGPVAELSASTITDAPVA
jgi:hypothetical protein